MLFVIDFDGTVAPTDTVDALLEAFADPEWRRVEERWVRGEINSQQCMKLQIGLVAGRREVLERFLSSVVVDPAFPEFVRFVSTFAELAIVSDGLDYPIRHAMRKLSLSDIPVYANKLEFRQDGLDLSFPYLDADCSVKSGVCKCAVARTMDEGRGLATILIGDGRSDLCIARTADYVFAKKSLKRFCEVENIVHTPFESFADVLDVIRQWDTPPRKKVFEETSCPLAP